MKKALGAVMAWLRRVFENGNVRKGVLAAIGAVIVFLYYYNYSFRELVAAEVLFGAGLAVFVVLVGISYVVGVMAERGLGWVEESRPNIWTSRRSNMTWLDQVGNLLKQYTSGGAAAQPAPDVNAHFDQVAQAAPASTIAGGLAAAFHTPTAMGQGIKIKGEISGHGDLFLDGEFEGSICIASGTLTIGPHARARAEIEAPEIIIRGDVIGTLKASERVHIWNTGKLLGDIETRAIVIDDGAVLQGTVGAPRDSVRQGTAPNGSLSETGPPPQPSSPEPPPRAKGASA